MASIACFSFDNCGSHGHLGDSAPDVRSIDAYAHRIVTVSHKHR